MADRSETLHLVHTHTPIKLSEQIKFFFVDGKTLRKQTENKMCVWAKHTLCFQKGVA